MSSILLKMMTELYGVYYRGGYRSASYVKYQLVSSQFLSTGFLEETRPTVNAVQKAVHGLQITFNGGDKHEATSKPLFLDYMWLFDNCRCSLCYDEHTFQRKYSGRPVSLLPAVDGTSQAKDWQPKSVVVDQQTVHISWFNGHQSSYDFDWLRENVYLPIKQKQKSEMKLWNGSIMKPSNFPRIFLGKSDDGASGRCEKRTEYFDKQLLNNLVTYGFCLIEGVEPTEEATRALVERFAVPHRTYFGEYWSVYQDAMKEDSAYSSVFIPPHNDCTYFSESPGLMVFHCLEEPASGGETILVDGFYCSDQLRRQDMASYCYLSSTPIESCYFDKNGNRFVHCDTVLRHHPFTHNMLQIRFNPLDMAPVRTIRQEEIRSFYTSYGSFARFLWDKTNGIQLALQPGTVLVFDNWRVLHSRNAFMGNRRHVYGCYVSRTEFLNRMNRAGIDNSY